MNAQIRIRCMLKFCVEYYSVDNGEIHSKTLRSLLWQNILFFRLFLTAIYFFIDQYVYINRHVSGSCKLVFESLLYPNVLRKQNTKQVKKILLRSTARCMHDESVMCANTNNTMRGTVHCQKNR
jgi:hypothetical protein